MQILKKIVILALILLLTCCSLNTPEDDSLNKDALPANLKITYNEWGLAIFNWESKLDADSIVLVSNQSGQKLNTFYPAKGERKLTLPYMLKNVTHKVFVYITLSDLTAGISSLDFTFNPDQSQLNSYTVVDFTTLTFLPSIVKVYFQVANLYGQGKANLKREEINVYDDNEPVSSLESITKILPAESQINIKILIDNSTSIEDNPNSLKIFRETAIEFVNKFFAIADTNKRIAVYKFSENIEKVLDYSSSKAAVIAAINSIPSVEKPTTNLYGALIEAVKEFETIIINKKDNPFIKAYSLLLFSDGNDTQHSETLLRAKAAIRGKRIFTVADGKEINYGVLGEISTNGYYLISSNQKVLLEQTIISMVDFCNDYVNSFYTLYYVSPKRGGLQHSFAINLKGNNYTGPLSTVLTKYSSSNFFSGQAGLHINASISKPNGIDTLYIGKWGADTLKASSFYAPNTPDIKWGTVFSLVNVFPVPAAPEKVVIQGKGNPGITSISVWDARNNSNPIYTKTLYIKVLNY